MLRTIRIDGDVVYIPLTKGYEAILDVTDFPTVDAFNWHFSTDGKTKYARRTQRVGGLSCAIYLHRALLCAPLGMLVDHIDGDGLNNRRSNLRLATKTENNRNSRTPITNSSGIKGISWCADRRKWRVQISVDGKTKSLGRFDDKVDASAAYARASADLHGEFGLKA